MKNTNSACDNCDWEGRPKIGLEAIPRLTEMMKIEVRYLEGQSPFRYPCWAGLRDGLVCAYCLSAEVADKLRLILSL